MPVAAAMARPVQCVVSPGGSPKVSSTTGSTVAGGSGGRPGFLVLSRSKPSTPASMNRRCQRQTLGLDTPARRMISAVPMPFGGRQDDPCPPGMLLRAVAIRRDRSSRTRSVALTSRLIPSRMPQRQFRGNLMTASYH